MTKQEIKHNYPQTTPEVLDTDGIGRVRSYTEIARTTEGVRDVLRKSTFGSGARSYTQIVRDNPTLKEMAEK